MLIKPLVSTLFSKLTFIVGLLVFTGVKTGGAVAGIDVAEKLTGKYLDKICALQNTAFAPKERIVYKLYYNLNFIWIAAGEVVFSVEDYGDKYKFVAVGETYPSYEWFFKVRDRYESYVDKKTLLPTLTIRDISEGKYTLYERVEYDQKAGTGVGWRGKSREEAMQRPAEFAINDCIHDVLSAIYFTRNLNLDVAETTDKFPLTVFMDRKEYPLGVRYLGKEAEKKIKGLGNFDVHELGPEVIAGDVFSEESEMRVWASADASHLPLLIESPLSVGSVKAVLKEHSNLRYQLAAK